MSKREIDCGTVESVDDTKKQCLEKPLFPVLSELPSIFQVESTVIRWVLDRFQRTH